MSVLRVMSVERFIVSESAGRQVSELAVFSRGKAGRRLALIIRDSHCRASLSLVTCSLVPASKVLAQVHPVVERCHLIGVAVEHERGAALLIEGQADAALGLLAPAGMVDVGIHVGVEAVFVGRLIVPGGGRLLVEEAHGHDRLGGFEAVLPGHHDADGSAVLVGQRFAVEAEGEQGERVHGLVHAQALGVGPVDGGVLVCPLLDLAVVVGEELDVLCAWAADCTA